MPLILTVVLWAAAGVFLLLSVNAFRRSSLTTRWRRAGLAAASIGAVFVATAGEPAISIPIALITAAAILAGTIARFGYAQSYQQDLERHLGRHPELAAAFQRNWLLRRVTRKSRR